MRKIYKHFQNVYNKSEILYRQIDLQAEEKNKIKTYMKLKCQ